MVAGLYRPAPPPGPSHDLSSEPQASAPATQIEHGSRHIEVSVLIDADRRAVGKSQQSCDPLRVDQIVEVDLPPHEPSIRSFTTVRVTV